MITNQKHDQIIDPSVKLLRVDAFYKFQTLENREVVRAEFLQLFADTALKGTVLLAEEGINGTLCGPESTVEQSLSFLRRLSGFSDLESKTSWSAEQAFLRLKVKLKNEIVTIGDPSVRPDLTVGTYVKPEKWDALVRDPDVLVIDTRNTYETAVGTFEGALDPKLESFRELPNFVAQNLDPKKHKKVAMFCTGGIRCEKSTALMLNQGFEEVYHLQGGILKYLETIDPSQSSWQGECFVFDSRVTVDHDLEPGSYDQCHACRRPITEDDKKTADYELGVSCPHCMQEKSEKQRQSYRERQKQVALAEVSHRPHLGDGAQKNAAQKMSGPTNQND